MTQDQREQVLQLLEKGYTQKNVARIAKVSMRDVGHLGRAFNVGRRPGMSRAAVKAHTAAPKSFESLVSRFFA